MYRAGGLRIASLWVAALTLAMGAAAASLEAGSDVGAICFLLTALVLAPPIQNLIGHLAHQLLPAKAALLASVTLLPIGLLFVGFDSAVKLETEARTRGFPSADHMTRARSLGLATAAALAHHDETKLQAARAETCRQQGDNRSLDCWEPGHRDAARAYARSILDETEYERSARDAVAQQRAAYLAADRNCAALLDRIETHALPLMLSSRAAATDILATLWARHLTRSEVELLATPAKPGESYMRTSEMHRIEKKVSNLTPALEKEFNGQMQAWALRLASAESTWQMLLGGRDPAASCKPALALAAK